MSEKDVYSFLITDKPITIGRGQGADLVINDKFCSTTHVSLVRENDFVIIKDLGSKNGTYLKGKKIEQEYLMLGEAYTIGKSFISIDQKRTSPELIPILTPTVKEKTSTNISLEHFEKAPPKAKELELQISKSVHQHDEKTIAMPHPNFKKLKSFQKKSEENSEKSGTILIKIFEKFLGKK